MATEAKVSLSEIGDFVWGVLGALVGGGVVYGRFTEKIKNLEASQEGAAAAHHASETAADRKREELSAEIRSTRSELKAEIAATRAELREDFRELQRLIVERVK